MGLLRERQQTLGQPLAAIPGHQHDQDTGRLDGWRPDLTRRDARFHLSHGSDSVRSEERREHSTGSRWPDPTNVPAETEEGGSTTPLPVFQRFGQEVLPLLPGALLRSLLGGALLPRALLRSLLCAALLARALLLCWHRSPPLCCVQDAMRLRRRRSLSLMPPHTP